MASRDREARDIIGTRSGGSHDLQSTSRRDDGRVLARNLPQCAWRPRNHERVYVGEAVWMGIHRGSQWSHDGAWDRTFGRAQPLALRELARPRLADESPHPIAMI